MSSRTWVWILAIAPALANCASVTELDGARAANVDDLTRGLWQLSRLEWVRPRGIAHIRLHFDADDSFEGWGGMADFTGRYELGPEGSLSVLALRSELTPLNVDVPTSLYEPSLDQQVGSSFGGTPVRQQERLEALLRRVDQAMIAQRRLLLSASGEVVLELQLLDRELPRPPQAPDIQSD